MEEKKNTAIDNFYKMNNIDDKRFTANNKEAALCGMFFDKNIPRSILQEKLSIWLSNFTKKDQKYFLALFENFMYITSGQLTYLVGEVWDDLCKKIGEDNLSDVAFVFKESSKGCKSGANDLAAEIWRHGEGLIEKKQLITNISSAKNNLVYNKKSIIFFDDIIATGFSMREVLRQFFTKYPVENFNQTKFYIISIFSTRRGERFIREKVIKDFDVEYIPTQEKLKSAFRGNYIFKNEDIADAEKIVLKYEKKSGKEVDGKIFEMGFAESKLLVGFAYEIPNNTLSTFWRYTEDFTPLFQRGADQGLTLNKIQKRKKEMQNRAYAIKCMENSNESI